MEVMVGGSRAFSKPVSLEIEHKSYDCGLPDRLADSFPVWSVDHCQYNLVTGSWAFAVLPTGRGHVF